MAQQGGMVSDQHETDVLLAFQRRLHAALRSRTAIDATAGALAGCVSRIVVSPLDVIKIRFQVQVEPLAQGASQLGNGKYTGMRQALRTIIKEEGIRGLWRGTVPGLFLTVPYTAVQFVALQQFRSFAAQHGLPQSPAVSFASGAFAGAAATVASYPFDLLRTTLAAQGEPKVYNSMSEAARGIMQHRGWRGLYSGLGVTLLEIIPYAALQFGLYDAFKQAAVSAHRRSAGLQETPYGHGQGDLSSFERFTCGLAAGTVAKLGTHPLDVVKKRYQVAGLQRSMRYGSRIDPNAVRSLGVCLAAILEHEGLRGLYKGAAPSIIKAAPAAAVTFVAYESFRSALARAAKLKQDEESAAAGGSGRLH